MHSEEEFRKAIENSPTAHIKDSSGKVTPLTGKEVREAGLNNAINSSEPVQIYKTDEGWSASIKDPFVRAGKEIDSIVSVQAPKVKIDGNKLVIQAPKEVLSSPLVSQIKEELQPLKGSDLKSAEVQQAIEALNNEVSNGIKDSLLNSATGWTREQYNDYQYARQTVSGTNPMASSNKIKGKDKDGNIIMRTPQEWVEYYREAYDSLDRSRAFKKSLLSSDPYERTMALVLGQGGNTAVYGFDVADKFSQLWKAFENQVGQAPEGIFRHIAEDNNTKRVESLSNELKISPDVIRKFDINDEGKFNQKREAIAGRTWKDLSDEEKAFVLLVGVTKENSMLRDVDRGAFRDQSSENLKNMSSPSDYYSRTAIEGILKDSSFDKYKELRNSYDTWQGYQDWAQEGERELAETADWSKNEQFWGNFGGVISRYLWEDAIGRGLTGGLGKGAGFSMGGISDKIGTGIVKKLASKGFSPTSTFGRGMLEAAANIIGTIPEDILQDSVDNILTYNMEENKNLLNPENISQDLIWVSIWNMGRAGISAVKKAKAIKKLEKAAKFIDKKMDIDGMFSDADDIKRAVDKGGRIKVDNDKVSIVDLDGKETVLKNTTPEQGRFVQKTLFDWSNGDTTRKVSSAPDNVTKTIEDASTASRTGSIADDAAKAVDGQPTVKIEIDAPGGRVRVDTIDYKFNKIDDIVSPSAKIEATPAGIKHWHNKAFNTALQKAQTDLFREFRTRFGDVTTSEFDWIFHNSKNGKTPSQIIGTVDPVSKRTITQATIDAAKWWAENPMVKKFRQSSLKALDKNPDENILGYLPHTDYDPSNLSFDEAQPGKLWHHYSGKSVLDDDGNFIGYGGTLEGRYRTFLSNMLWDMRNRDVSTAKIIEEAKTEGIDLTPKQAAKVVDDNAKVIRNVDNASSTKNYEKMVSNNSDMTVETMKKFNDEQIKNAETSGVGKSIHDAWSPVFKNSNKLSVTHQRNSLINNFDTLGNFLRRTTIGNGLSLYDWGGADLVYSPQNAIAIIKRYTKEGGDLEDMLIEYLQKHSHRSLESAEFVADKWMNKLGEIDNLTNGQAIDSLARSMKWEAWGRIRKWLVMAKYDEFNASTKKNIDRFLFNHMQMDSITNNHKIRKLLGKALDTMTSLRYDALFYGNIKNALLQTSELNRYFTQFKWGDVATMAKKLATDENFRARVEDYYSVVAPMTPGLEGSFKDSGVNLSTKVYQGYSDLADNMEVKKDNVVFKKLKQAKETADSIGLAPINTAEAFKNRMMVAGLVQEADRLGLSGDDALRHIRRRFERVALAADEMGRIGLASNPLAKNILFLQNFQIRELGMHLYNILDDTGMLKNGVTPKGVFDAGKYLTKVLGSKLATALIMARLGYPAAQALGIDPFGLLDQYNGLDQEDVEWQDYFFMSPLFSGGMTSMISDMYFLARKAYEESENKSISEEAEDEEKNTWGVDLSKVFSWDNAMDVGQKFVPGNTFLNRIGQMNELMDTGWATSSTGNKMYTAPTNPIDIVMGYLFGRSATSNAQQYQQTYGDNLFQTIGRFNPFRQYGEFDPIDTRNYSDWFKGNENDLQQFEKGRRYFRQQRDRILDEYEDAIRKSYSTTEDIAEAKNDMNQKLEDLYNQLDRFVEAYEKKNGTINAAMTKQIISLLNTGRLSIDDNSNDIEKWRNEQNAKALERYSALGLSPVGTYTGPTVRAPEKEVKYQGSPQYRTAINGRYNLSSEAVAVLKEADRVLEDERKNLKNAINAAYDSKNWNELRRIQRQYLEKFDKAVAPIIAAYGSGILTSTDVANQLKDMLSTGTISRSGDLIPSDQYRKDKRGWYRSMPYETVDVKKWAQKRYSSNLYKNPTVRSYSTAQNDLDEIRRLSSRGQNDRARARALQLKVRVDNQRRSLSRADYQWLLDFLNNEGSE